MNRNKKRHPTEPTELFERQLLTDSWKRRTFSKLANFYISEFSISVVCCHLAKLLCHLTLNPKFTAFISPIKPVTRHESILFTFDFPVLIAGVLAWTFRLDLYFRSKILAYLTVDLKTRGSCKADNKIINSIIHHDHWVKIWSMSSQ